ncbi:MAG: thiol-disulfide isomerase/thioredoxin [Cycloclasticus pugetii]|jgi:thiol-disulfide isomerase/thioredoxin|uniref:Thiol-disulfide isomerase and thioredoxins n=1 Tax=Cycloclasticus zancles 78-ME TaxID=1198232 RepID=S5TV37_9GAMM|nr:glutaredoxin family protein [Cycloclasticus zancles]AGS38888.1 Thiol-disulfide isomerase and thioredoxins [Cycloclasticus zancles 78-ME]KXJ59537.1 MAG: hypothetical protein AXW14_15355 [Alteromonas sp. Nap_26]MDF1689486.1 glutaredoxin family protein [Cycloclasticus sp.]
MIAELTFYTTEGCHLCEDAKTLLQQLLSDYPDQYQVEIVDIVCVDSLIEQYGTRIPVIKQNGLTADLGWPFDYKGLLRFLGENIE